MNKKIALILSLLLYILALSFTITYLKEFNSFSIIYDILFIICNLYILIYTYFILIYIFYKFSKLKFKINKLTKEDFINQKDYFRYLLKEYSISELSYIDNFEITTIDIIAILLQLKNKKKITIDENKNIIIINDIDIKLKKEEEYVLNCIYNGKIDAIDTEALSLITQKSAYEDKLLQESSHKHFNYKLIIIILFLLLFPTFIISIITNKPIIGIIYMLFLFISIIALIINYLVYDTLIINNKYKRTELGEEINQKLEGLKNFLKDFTILNERDAQEIIIWEDYLIYSVMFNQNVKIINQYQNLFRY